MLAPSPRDALDTVLERLMPHFDQAQKDEARACVIDALSGALTDFDQYQKRSTIVKELKTILRHLEAACEGKRGSFRKFVKLTGQDYSHLYSLIIEAETGNWVDNPNRHLFLTSGHSSRLRKGKLIYFHCCGSATRLKYCLG